MTEKSPSIVPEVLKPLQREGLVNLLPVHMIRRREPT
jgi:hypothetical protein